MPNRGNKETNKSNEKIVERIVEVPVEVPINLELLNQKLNVINQKLNLIPDIKKALEEEEDVGGTNNTPSKSL